MTTLPGVRNILAIRFARLGDVILLLPALVRLKTAFDGARLTLLTGSPCAAAARMCPGIDEILAVDRLRMRDGPKPHAVRDIFGLVTDLRRREFDLAVDFHSFRETNLLAWASKARYRLGMKRSDRAYLSFCFNLDPVLEDKGLHVAEMFDRVAEGVPGVGSSSQVRTRIIRVPAAVQERVRKLTGTRPPVTLYAGASVTARRWPPSRFAAVAKYAAEQWGVPVLIVAGASPAEEAMAREIHGCARGEGEVRLLSGLTIPEMAGVVASTCLLVSNDSGPMHLGPALGTPTLGIFSSSLPEHYRPRGPLDRYIKKDSIEDIEVPEVIEAMEGMWASVNRGRRL